MTLTHEGGVTGVGPDKSIIIRIFADAQCTDLAVKGLTYPGYSSLISFKATDKSAIIGRVTLYFYGEDEPAGKVEATPTPTGAISKGSGIW